jgi:hypothetical protein
MVVKVQQLGFALQTFVAQPLQFDSSDTPVAHGS